MKSLACLQDKAHLFWNKVDIAHDGCWPWMGGKYHDGYGRFDVRVESKKKHFRAHRVAFFLTTSIDPHDLLVCHSCDNPICCNPNHLWLGTAQDNSTDAVDKGRASGGSTVDNRFGAKLSRQQVMEIITQLPRLSNVALGREFSVTHQTIWAIRHKLTWLDVWGELEIGKRWGELK